MDWEKYTGIKRRPPTPGEIKQKIDEFMSSATKEYGPVKPTTTLGTDGILRSIVQVQATRPKTLEEAIQDVFNEFKGRPFMVDPEPHELPPPPHTMTPKMIESRLDALFRQWAGGPSPIVVRIDWKFGAQGIVPTRPSILVSFYEAATGKLLRTVEEIEAVLEPKPMSREDVARNVTGPLPPPPDATPQPFLYIALHSTVPGPRDGQLFAEISAPGYARQAIRRRSELSRSQDGGACCLPATKWGIRGSATQFARAWSIGTSAEGDGKIIFYGNIDPPIALGVPFELPPLTLSIGY